MEDQIRLMRDQIKAVGERMVACTRSCPGIALDQAKGILPRCLILETQGRADRRGAVILGINPARTPGYLQEREFYRREGAAYDSVVRYWRDNLAYRHQYYLRLRRLADGLGWDGPLLWTEIVKCENADDGNIASDAERPPLQTLRSCADLYLREELRLVPEAWPILATGLVPFRIAALLFPHRRVLGVPHATGARGNQFTGLFVKGHPSRLTDRVLEQSALLESNPIPQAVWLKT